MIGLNMKTSELLYKALFNSMVGTPLAILVNILVIPPMASYIHQEPILGSLLLSIPFFITSTSRQFLIDYFYFKHGIMLDPKVHIERIINRFKK